MFEILLALLIMPTLGWRWLLRLSALPVGFFLIFSHVGISAIDRRPQNKTGGEPNLSVWCSGFLRVLASTYCRDAPPRLWKLSYTSPNRTGGPCLKQRLLPLKRWDADLAQSLEAANVPTAVVSVQDHRGQIKDLFTPQLRKTTVLLSFIWLGILFSHSCLILVLTWPNPHLCTWRISAAFCYYGIILLTPDLLQSVKSWGCKSHTYAFSGFGTFCGKFADVLLIFFLAAAARAQDEPVCGLECKYLTSDDYEKMLWTSFAEIPGTTLPFSQGTWTNIYLR